MPYRRRSLLPLLFALIYGLSIVYASLQPLLQWMPLEPGQPFFLFAPWPARVTRYDALANLLAYAPFGFFVAATLRDRQPGESVFLATIAGVALSFALETAQMFLPPRDASTVDVLSNSAGTLAGALVANLLLRSARIRSTIVAARTRWFLGGHTGDLGLALLAIWLAVQVNPGIPLFATVFDTATHAGPVDAAALLIEGVHSALQVLGVGLFVALIVRERRLVGVAVMLLLSGALLIKGVAAMLLLRPAAWEHWQSPAVSVGVAVGALLLPVVIFMPRPAQVALCAVTLLASVLAVLFVPEMLQAGPPVSLFNRGYGHLLTFNGLTRTVLLCWPLAASLFLFALAGRPQWGDPTLPHRDGF